MVLHGPFEVFGFSEILRLLATKGATGRLTVGTTGSTAKLYLDKGRLTSAEVEERHPTAPAETGVNEGLVDACARFVHCERGSFEFEPGLASPSASDTTEAEVERTLALARVRAEEWRRIAVVVPSLAAQPSLEPEVLDEPVILSRDQWRLVTAIDGRRSVMSLARVIGMSTLGVCRLLTELAGEGAVRFTDQPRAAIEAWQVEEAEDQSEEGLIKLVSDRPEPVIEGGQPDDANGDGSTTVTIPDEDHKLNPDPRETTKTWRPSARRAAKDEGSARKG
jgi:hypothetical protein